MKYETKIKVNRIEFVIRLTSSTIYEKTLRVAKRPDFEKNVNIYFENKQNKKIGALLRILLSLNLMTLTKYVVFFLNLLEKLYKVLYPSITIVIVV